MVRLFWYTIVLLSNQRGEQFSDLATSAEIQSYLVGLGLRKMPWDLPLLDLRCGCWLARLVQPQGHRKGLDSDGHVVQAGVLAVYL